VRGRFGFAGGVFAVGRKGLSNRRKGNGRGHPKAALQRARGLFSLAVWGSARGRGRFRRRIFWPSMGHAGLKVGETKELMLNVFFITRIFVPFEIDFANVS